MREVSSRADTTQDATKMRCMNRPAQSLTAKEDMTRAEPHPPNAKGGVPARRRWFRYSWDATTLLGLCSGCCRPLKQEGGAIGSRGSAAGLSVLTGTALSSTFEKVRHYIHVLVASMVQAAQLEACLEGFGQ
jgi:hypothetical protein